MLWNRTKYSTDKEVADIDDIIHVNNILMDILTMKRKL